MSSPLLTPLAAAVLHVGEPERILQIQCCEDKGEGPLFLAREFPIARVRGIDRDERAIRHAAARVGLDPEGRIAFKPGSPSSIPFPDDHFDLFVAVDTRPAVKEAQRVLRPGGFLTLVETRRERASGRFRAWRLARAGLEPIWEEMAGDGSFAVFRLRGGGPVGGSL